MDDFKMAGGILGNESKRRGLGAISFEVKLFFAVIILLSWPVSICYFLYEKPSVSYWFGHWEIILANGIVIWTIAMYALFLFKLMSKGTATILLLVLPCTTLAISSELQELQFQFISAALGSQDCSSNVEKVHIQEAWEVAKNTSVNCDKYLMKLTGSSKEELAKVRRFESCPDYYQAMGSFEKEWMYLRGLELSYQCGGWCTPDYPLWTLSKTPLDSCSLVAGHAMKSSIAHMGQQLSVYSFIILISVSLWLLLRPKWLQDEI